MNKAFVLACCALMLASAGASAEVYKWKDKSGKTHYSDSPPMSNVPYSTLSGKKPAGAPAPAPVSADAAPGGKPGSAGTPVAGAPPRPGEASPAGGKPAADARTDTEAQKKAQEEKAAREAEAKRQQEERLAAEKRVKEQNCKNARARVAQFQQGGRIYRVNEQGERLYYGDQEIASELEQAKADVEANCE